MGPVCLVLEVGDQLIVLDLVLELCGDGECWDLEGIYTLSKDILNSEDTII